MFGAAPNGIGQPDPDSPAIRHLLTSPHRSRDHPSGFAMCHKWKIGNLLMWNNSSLFDRGDPFDPKSRRVRHRANIKSDERVL
jgi:alpha-ketoglutarate-dependent taurine dioxygenase